MRKCWVLLRRYRALLQKYRALLGTRKIVIFGFEMCKSRLAAKELCICGSVGLFCGNTELFCGDTELFCGNIGLLA